MAADNRIDEVAIRPIRAFSDEGALPANHIGLESVGQSALERRKPRPAVFDRALEGPDFFPEGNRANEQFSLDRSRLKLNYL